MSSNIFWISIFFALLLKCLLVESHPPYASDNERIVGGQNTTIDRFPYQVSLRLNGRHFCGGSILRMTVIITAAHCVAKPGITDDMTVVAGSSFRSEVGLERKVFYHVIHDKYDVNPTRNDVALLILNKPLYFSDNVQPISLPKTADFGRAGTKAIVSGWGTLQEGGPSPNQLQSAAVHIVSNEECSKKYGSGLIDSSMLCAGEDAGGKDACQGDSGGPLAVGNVLVGIVSWGRGCARPDYPGVYADVNNLKEWIEMILSYIE